MASIDRRRFTTGLASIAFAGFASRALAETPIAPLAGYGPLLPDPAGLLDLPEGFSYRVISSFGDVMDDGFLVPGHGDGMGCIALGGDRVALIRNHELKDGEHRLGPSGGRRDLADRLKSLPGYDGIHPGGTTTIIYDMRAARVVREHLSLTGTVMNCAGGTTPWGSWLSCEETVRGAGGGRAKSHGWVFEVPANSGGVIDAAPLTGLGRFRHEAAAVDPRNGVVYLTEDDDEGLFYRFLPDAPGALRRGGRLQAMGFAADEEGDDCRNWTSEDWPRRCWKRVRWIDLEGVDNPHNDLRQRAIAFGAVRLARPEGVHYGHGEFYFCCTSGGKARLGQILRYVPSRFEGRPDEAAEPGRLQLFVESANRDALDYADNLTVAPWGHLIVCEDQKALRPTNHMRGVTPDGRIYSIGRLRTRSELAGTCFSPDGATLFMNIYHPTRTVAITGPWRRLAV